MTNRRLTGARWRGVRAAVACSFGLAAWLAGHGAWAQRRTWGEAFHEMGPWYRRDHPPPRSDDPDLVRAGAFPTWQATLADGATAVVDAAKDLDGDGVTDRLLTVSPRADPYPFDMAAGLVLVRHAPDGFRATVLLREPDYELRWGVWRSRGRPAVYVTWRWTEGHASEGFTEVVATHEFRLERDGTLREAGPARQRLHPTR